MRKLTVVIGLVVVAALGSNVACAQPLVPLNADRARPENWKAPMLQMQGEWEAIMRNSWDSTESRFSAVYKMNSSGLWLIGEFRGEAFGRKFEGTSMESYDAAAKTYVNIWTDSMSGTPRVSEGTYNPKKRLTTLVSGGGQFGVRTIREVKDKDTMVVTIWGPDGSGFGSLSVTTTFKRKRK